ncbi:hypothetical protein AB0M95_08865 [Sphaerisporangium sp. NPDC051017]|uniref:hypothetical protein n=1 Tax=Sphaerisporangium sp. NPDC051017 TaxID=3154636 RepID=UPI003437932F
MNLMGEGISARRAQIQREALAGVRDAMASYGLRCLLVDRVRLSLRWNHSARVQEPPCLDVYEGTRLLVTITAHDRPGRRPMFSVARPGGVRFTSLKVEDVLRDPRADAREPDAEDGRASQRAVHSARMADMPDPLDSAGATPPRNGEFEGRGRFCGPDF